MRLQLLTASFALCLTLACGTGNDEGDGFARVIGQTCEQAKHHSNAHREAGGWTAQVYYNASHVQIVADRNGVLREQTVRECPSVTGIGAQDPSITDARSAIDYVARLFGVTPVY